MKKQANNVPATLATSVSAEVVSTALFVVDGDKLTLAPGARPVAQDFADAIRENVDASRTAGNRAAWAWYQAGRVEGVDVDKLRSEIKSILASDQKDDKGNVIREALTDSAIRQIVSAGNRYVPLIADGTFKTTVSVLKDAAAALSFDKDGKLLPADKQTTAGKALLPMLQSGVGITQAKIREVRKEIPVTEGGTKKAEAAPVAEVKPKTQVDIELEAETAIREHLQFVCKKLELTQKHWANDPAVNILTDIARKMGMALVVSIIEPNK